MLDEVKDAFKFAMGRLYPGGVAKQQQRDLVHIYVMGWADCMMRSSSAADQLTEDWMTEVAKPLANVFWLPDDSWNWW